MSARRSVLRVWAADLALGLRLAVGGSRSPWGRLVTTAVGIGVGVAVLLLASAVPNMIEDRDGRGDARQPVMSPEKGGDLLVAQQQTEFRGQQVAGMQVQVKGPDVPLPPGVERLPGPGELVVSPGLAEILRSPDGSLLAPRVPGQVVGTITPDGLQSPDELYYYAGVTAMPQDDPAAGSVTSFGVESPTREWTAEAWVLIALGVSALLVPVVVFVASTTRLAEAARSRRLAALRLVGADGRQVRRIAAGEALVGAVAGVVIGWAVFLVGRMLAGGVSVVGFTTFTGGIWPSWWYAVLITVLVPVLAAVTANAAMRRTIIEPLGVLRVGEVRPRRALWRFAPLVLGAGGVAVFGIGGALGETQVPFVASIVLMLVGVPLVLPWVVERVVRRLGAGPLAWQLAVRRLQITSATAARSVSAVAVVLTGVVALQTALSTAEASFEEQDVAVDRASADEQYVYGVPRADSPLHEVVEPLDAVQGVSDVDLSTSASLQAAPQRYQSVMIADCATITRRAQVAGCQDGDVFFDVRQHREGAPLPPAGEVWHPTSGVPETGEAGAWRVPERILPMEVTRESSMDHGALLWLTPQAASTVPMQDRSVSITLRLDPASSPDSIEQVRNVANAHLDSSSFWSVQESRQTDERQMFTLVKYGLLLGALVTFALIGCGLFVSAAEQIQERRRPIAVLGAVGVPKATLRRSLLLQNLVPMTAAVAVAVVTGLVLGVLVCWAMTSGAVVFDLPGMAGICAIALVSVLVVTALAWPTVRRALHPEGLRTE